MQAIDGLADRLVGGDRIADLCDAQAIPEYFRSIPARLAAMAPSAPVAPDAEILRARLLSQVARISTFSVERRFRTCEVNLLNLR